MSELQILDITGYTRYIDSKSYFKQYHIIVTEIMKVWF